MNKVTIFDHPLIQHKTTIIRKKTTSNKEFREMVEEITMLMCYEALRYFVMVICSVMVSLDLSISILSTLDVSTSD